MQHYSLEVAVIPLSTTSPGWSYGITTSVFEGALEADLGLAGAFGDDLWSIDEEEVGAGLGRNGAGQDGLSTAGGAGEEDSLGRADAELVPELRVAEG
mmetsp:Transcript_30992/g.70887  ORF Transcript_30992/g.70887 Transcript_30992/m.70887 type:complete len:98 (+) Transcript_30992:120-413(+)